MSIQLLVLHDSPEIGSQVQALAESSGIPKTDIVVANSIKSVTQIILNMKGNSLMLVVGGEFVRNNHDLGNIVSPLSWITKLSALGILDLGAPNLDTIGEILNGGFVMGIVEEGHRDQIVEFLKSNKATD